jgi:hypothetical protein
LTRGRTRVKDVGVLNWLRGRTFRRGDAVRVTGGLYAGRDGFVAGVGGDGLVGVYIDECCQPRLEPRLLRRRGGRRDVGQAVRDAKESDVEGEIARATMDARDRGDGF